MQKINDDNEKRRATPVNDIPLPGDNRDRKELRKSLGEVIMGSAAMKAWRSTKSPHMSEELGFGLPELKATFLTTAGWAPETTRTGLVVDKATRPIQVIDLIPSGTTGQAAVKYMEETTLTHASAERAENAAYAESSFALTERSEAVRSIGASVPVTDEQLDDVEGVQSYLEQRLMFGNRQRLDGQIVIGDGIAPNLLGLKNKSGIQVQAKGADSNLDAIYKALVLVQLTGRASPSGIIIHPTNMQAIQLLKTADGIYIWGSPTESGLKRIWGLTPAISDADAAGIAYVADFVNFTMLFERKGMEVAVGYVNADFLNGRRTIRAGLRVAFAIFRAAAVCQVTGLV
jgi:HK97 family phage major capsid protein